jgi:hypothetical protein
MKQSVRAWVSQLVISFIVVGGAFVCLNSWNVLECDDCMIPRGRPFPYRITEGYATPPRVLWGGLAADVAMLGAATFLLVILLRFVATKLASGKA